MTGALTRGQARFAVALLFGVNFLNYIDRYVIAAVLPLIQQEFHLDDAHAGYVLSMFVLVYMAASGAFYLAGSRSLGRDTAHVQEILTAREARHASSLHDIH